MDKGKMRASSFLDKISTMRVGGGGGKDKKDKHRGDRYATSTRLRGLEDCVADAQQMVQFQQTINRMPEHELNIKFEQMLDDMNLTDEKKQPLRLKRTEEKKAMLAMQFKGSMQPKGQIDTPEEFIEVLNSPELRGDKRYDVVASLRVALKNNPVSWVICFGKKNGLNGILKNLNYCFDKSVKLSFKAERRSTLECVRCLRAYTNNRFGLMQIISHDEALTILARCIDPRDPSATLEAVKLLAAISLVPPDGHDKVMEGITICGEIRSHERFLPIVQGLAIDDPLVKTACLQLINALVSTPDDLDYRLHVRNEFMRAGLMFVIDSLERIGNEEVRTQVRIFTDHKEEDSEELSHRYDNIRFEMDDPRQCFELLYNSTFNTQSEPYFLSILQHLLTIRDDMFARPQYYQLIEECVTQIVLHKSGVDPDFRRTKRFDIDVEPLLGRLSDDASDDGSNSNLAPRLFKLKLEDAITAKQEFEAKVTTLEDKVKQYETEINELKIRITGGIGATIGAALSTPHAPPSNVPLPPGSIPPPPPLPGGVPPPPPIGGMMGPPGFGPPPPPPFAVVNQLPSFVKPKKKYNPGTQMKRINWTKINLSSLEKESFWVRANEERLASDDIFKGLMSNFAVKVFDQTDGVTDFVQKPAKKGKELKVLDSKAGQNLSILLGSIKVPHEEIKRRIIEMDEANLTVAMLEQLIKYLPNQEQMNQLAALKDQYRSLAESEQFGVVMSSIKRVVPRLASMAFKMNFAELVAEIKPDVVVATAALEEVRQSKKFAKILELILLLGNFMNAGSRNEQTIGFELSCMPKLSNTKTIDNKQTLMHFLVSTIQKRFPDILDFSDELMHVEKAARVSEDNVQKNVTQLTKSLKQLEIDIKNAQQDKTIPPNDQFLSVMTFVVTARDQCQLLEGMGKKMTSLFLDTAKYYCFDPKKYVLEDFFGDLKLFIESFYQAAEDLVKLKESEEKARRTKEAQEKREREKQEKIARKKVLVDFNKEDDDQEGVMDNLIEALKTGSAFNVNREKKEKKRTPRVAGAERRAQLVRSRSRQNLLSPAALPPENIVTGNSSGGAGGRGIVREIRFDQRDFEESPSPVHNQRASQKRMINTSGHSSNKDLNKTTKSLANGNGLNGHHVGNGDVVLSQAEEILERLRAW